MADDASRLRRELDEVQLIVTAAVMTATAFRLKDNDALTPALRILALQVKEILRLDDSLDVIAVHLVGGLIGTLLVGVFGDSAVNGRDGLLYGVGLELLVDQAIGAVAVMLFSGIVTYVIATAIDRTVGLRVDLDSELEGLDQTQHAESAYQA